jgi:hypothetical protein
LKYTNNGERGELVDGVATLEKLANGGAPSKIVTKLANGAPPLVNGENGERSGTVPRRNKLNKFDEMQRFSPTFVLVT